MRFDRIDAQSLREAAAAFDKANMTELAAMAREAASEAKLKEPAWRVQSRRQRRASKAAYRKAIERSDALGARSSIDAHNVAPRYFSGDAIPRQVRLG
jgi:hypothetical protein